MARFLANNTLAGSPQSISSSYQTLISVVCAGANPKRFEIDGIILSEAGDLVDFDLSQQTAAGSSASADPIQVEPTGPFANSVVAVNYASEGTITSASSALFVRTSQTFRWEAKPGSALVAPAVANQGFALRARSGTYTGNAFAQVSFKE